MTNDNLKNGTANDANTMLQEVFCEGQRVVIPVCAIEFNVGSNTIWIQSTQGGTTLRLKCKGKINIDQCKNSPISHSDIMVDGDIVGFDAETDHLSEILQHAMGNNYYAFVTDDELNIINSLID